jgi:acyl-homoserine lactone synthase
MLITVTQANRAAERQVLRSMFEARKHVFVDLLKWDVPVIADRYEVDQFDNEHATYLILSDETGAHLASARLLETTRPALLDSLFTHLCDAPPPNGEHVREITRFCLSRDLPAPERRRARDRLVTALVLHALETGITCYTGIAEIGWYKQIFGFGWTCRPLGPLSNRRPRSLGAFAVDIDRQTPARLQKAGIFRICPTAAAARAA